ncbi:MAG: Ni/Fe hydrogenase subunit alpha [Anaerolineaceae bacterium]|nr:MAG: Ni/Fe hydrogenase subunit alpha [Anaerolineaceae bacterium]
MKVAVNQPVQIEVEHIARVEGHGNIKIRVEDGQLIECSWEVVETPRFFEKMFQGLSIEAAPLLAARVCGICSISHALASVRAIERGLGVEIPAMAKSVRLLAKHAETLQSHALHLFFLVAPDLLGVGSVIPLMKTHPELIEIATRIKRYANEASDLFAGRTSHPMVFKIGGTTQRPRKSQLLSLREDLAETAPYLWDALEAFKDINLPDFERETEYVSLGGNGDYPFIGGDLVSSDGVRKSEDEYRAMTNEYMVDHSTSKFAKLSRASFAVGALSRFNNNFEGLHPIAKEVAQELGLQSRIDNPYFHNLAQLVECFHVLYESKELIDELIDSPDYEVATAYEIRACEGVSAIEAPRGILYHYYQINKQGLIERADCVIPTGQNHANIQHDLEALVTQMTAEGREESEISLSAQMLVRAYDPCISCSVH